MLAAGCGSSALTPSAAQGDFDVATAKEAAARAAKRRLDEAAARAREQALRDAEAAAYRAKLVEEAAHRAAQEVRHVGSVRL